MCICGFAEVLSPQKIIGSQIENSKVVKSMVGKSKIRKLQHLQDSNTSCSFLTPEILLHTVLM
jgi:hypothetical protein